MKKWFFCCLILFPFYSFSKVWTVDNSANSKANFTTISDAQTAASKGDTIIVTPSNIDYGGTIYVSKKLFIYTSSHANNNFDKDKKVVFGGVVFTTGSDSTVMMGFYITSHITVGVSNIQFINNYFHQGLSVYGNNCIIKGNVITGLYYLFPTVMINFQGGKNNQIVNNYFSLKVTTANLDGLARGFIYGADSSNLIANNVIVEIQDGGSIIKGGLVYFRDCHAKIYNNILWSNAPNRSPFDTLDGSNAVYKNNITYSAKNKPTALSGSGNFNDTMPQFKGNYNDTLYPYYRTNNNMELKTSTMGKNAGTDGTDIGLFGRNFKFSMVGESIGVAQFDEFKIVKPVLKRGEKLKIKVKAH